MMIMEAAKLIFSYKTVKKINLVPNKIFTKLRTFIKISKNNFTFPYGTNKKKNRDTSTRAEAALLGTSVFVGGVLTVLDYS